VIVRINGDGSQSMIRIASTAAAVVIAGIGLVGVVPVSTASAAPRTPVCTWVVTASGLYIHSAPNDKTDTRIGETFKGDSVSAPLPLTESNNYVLATSRGIHGYLDLTYLNSEGCG
jgi:hypothetical protein